MKISAWWLYRLLPTIHGASCQISGSPAVRQAQLPILEIVKQANRHRIVVCRLILASRCLEPQQLLARPSTFINSKPWSD